MNISKNVLSRFYSTLSLALLPLLLKLLFAIWAVSVCLHFRPSVSSVACLVFGCFSFVVCRNIDSSVVHSVVIVCEEGILLLFKFLLKFRNVLKHTESRSSLACN